MEAVPALLASASQTITSALASYDKETRRIVADTLSNAQTATSDAQKARLERDDAIKALKVSQREDNAWKDEARTCKSALDQAELTINHQTETIAQLQREVSQWKDQSRNWQEHFLRVEQERCRLSARIEELAAERVFFNAHAAMGATPYTPRTNYANMIEPQTSSTTTKRASTSSYESTDVMTEDTPLKKKHKVAHATDISRREPATLPDTRQKPYVQVPKVKTPKPRRTTARTPTGMAHRPVSPTHARSEPRQTTLIRRVQTVVEMPVKEEDDDDDPTELFSTSISASGSRSDAGGTIASRKRSTRLRARKQSRRVVDDEDSDAGSDVDDEAADSRGRGGDDDDDELRMGVEVNRKELYGGIQRISGAPETSHASNHSSRIITTVIRPATVSSSAKIKSGNGGRVTEKTRK